MLQGKDTVKDIIAGFGEVRTLTGTSASTISSQVTLSEDIQEINDNI